MNTDMSVFIVHMSVFTCHSGMGLAYHCGMNTDMDTMNTDMSVFIVHMSVFTCHSGMSLAYLGGMTTDMETMNTDMSVFMGTQPYKRQYYALIRAESPWHEH